jgi:ubiquinone/menaquinone biosynthesis C-methylase UbiE
MKKTVIEKHFDKIAKNYDSGKHKYSYYYKNLKMLLGSLIPDSSKVFEIGCGTGDLLVHLRPKIGYGMDISDEMIKIAKSKHVPNKYLKFSTFWPKDKFDYIFMSDVIEHLDNPEDIFNKISFLMNKKSIFICTMANPFWEPLLMFWERLGWKMKEGPHKRIEYKVLKGVVKRSGMKIIKHGYKLLVPIDIPLITEIANKYLEKPFRKFAFIEYFVARAI